MSIEASPPGRAKLWKVGGADMGVSAALPNGQGEGGVTRRRKWVLLELRQTERKGLLQAPEPCEGHGELENRTLEFETKFTDKRWVYIPQEGWSGSEQPLCQNR